MHSTLQNRESTGASFLYNLRISNKMLLNEKLPNQVKEFSAENCPNGSLAKFAKLHTYPYKFVACPPNRYKLSLLGDI